MLKLIGAKTGLFAALVVAGGLTGAAVLVPGTAFAGMPHSSLSTQLKCPQRVTTGGKGTCTLYVTDNGADSAGSVSASIVLPGPLNPSGCTLGRSWWGCAVSYGVAFAQLGSLHHGQTKSLSVTFSGHLPGRGWQRTHAERVSVRGYAQDNASRWSSSATVTILPRFVR